jgi:hypothetical protein
LILCIPGASPLIKQLTPPTTRVGTPRGLDLNNGDLYILDPSANAVWIYRNLDVSQLPRLFFGDQIPPMENVIDLAVNGDDLYLLYADGHQTRCTYSSIPGVPTRCEDPLPYNDRRDGMSSGPVIGNVVFNQIYYQSPPDPSLYLLDPSNQAVYHFGLNLTFLRQYRPLTMATGEKATAFTVSENRQLFMAFGNQVLYANLP